MKGKSVVFVHGIGPKVSGYSDSLWNILWQSQPSGEVRKYEALYSDIYEDVNRKLEIEKMAEKYGLDRIVEGFIENSDFRARIDQAITAVLRDTVSHVLYFLLIEDAQNAILNRFKEKIVEALETAKNEGFYPPDHEITIISHSLGTVVAYMGLHSIIAEEGLGLQDRVRVKTLFTLATPLGLIKKVGSMLNIDIPHVSSGICKPEEWNSIKGTSESNIKHWYVYRHKFDPVASIVPLVGGFLDSRDESPYLFDVIHKGGVHAFDNYLERSRDLILKKILEEQ